MLLTVGLAFLGVAASTSCSVPIRSRPRCRNPAGQCRSRHSQLPGLPRRRCRLGPGLMIALWFIFDRTSFGARCAPRSTTAAWRRRSASMSTAVHRRLRARLWPCRARRCDGLRDPAAGADVSVQVSDLLPVVVALTGFGNIKASAWISMLVGIVDTAARFLVPSLGAFIVYFVLIGMMMWRNQSPFASGTSEPRKCASPSRSVVPRTPRSPRCTGTACIRWKWCSGARPCGVLPASAIPGLRDRRAGGAVRMSLDLILGFAGIISLGHALYFGFGAYAAGTHRAPGRSRSPGRCSAGWQRRRGRR